jgi:transposase
MAKLYAGLDVSQESTALCVVDGSGIVVFEAVCVSQPDSIAKALAPYRRSLVKVGHETGLFTPWLHRELLRRRFPAICLDARRTRAALSGQRNKTDRNDARDIALVLSHGFAGGAYVKTDDAYRTRLLLAYRRALKRKARDLESLLRSSAKIFGARFTKDDFVSPQRRRQIASFLVRSAKGVMRARTSLLTEAAALEREIRSIASKDRVCKRLMTAPGVGPITALTFKAAIDDPRRFASSRDVGAHFGLTPRRRQSGASDPQGAISRYGDGEVRAALYEAASTMLNCCKKPSNFRSWGLRLAELQGHKFASTACARKLAVILHRMWITETDFVPQH